MIDIEKVRGLLDRVKRMHPSMHARDTKLIDTLVNIVDSYIDENGRSRDVLIEVGGVLDEIKSVSTIVYNAMVMRSRYKSLYPVSLSLYKWHSRIKKSSTYGFWRRISSRIRRARGS